MKTIEIIGYRRANLGKTGSQKLRDEDSFRACCTEELNKYIFMRR
jgi:hypothetical protein